MSLDLDETFELVQNRLEKFGLDGGAGAGEICCRVVNISDGSGTMQNLYRNGTMKELFDRIYGAANRLSFYGDMDQYVFSVDYVHLPRVQEGDHESYFQQYLRAACNWGGTKYSPVLWEAIESYDSELVPVTIHSAMPLSEHPKPGFFRRIFNLVKGLALTPDEMAYKFTDNDEVLPGTFPFTTYERRSITPVHPMLIIFQTDGDNLKTDEETFFRMLDMTHGKPIFVMFLGLDSHIFSILRIAGGRYPNCDFVSMPDVKALTLQQFYDTLLSDKFLNWFKEIRGSHVD